MSVSQQPRASGACQSLGVDLKELAITGMGGRQSLDVLPAGGAASDLADRFFSRDPLLGLRDGSKYFQWDTHALPRRLQTGDFSDQLVGADCRTVGRSSEIRTIWKKRELSNAGLGCGGDRSIYGID
jgi:hypothetical protein